jgi:hypothetical protein
MHCHSEETKNRAGRKNVERAGREETEHPSFPSFHASRALAAIATLTAVSAESTGGISNGRCLEFLTVLIAPSVATLCFGMLP